VEKGAWFRREDRWISASGVVSDSGEGDAGFTEDVARTATCTKGANLSSCRPRSLLAPGPPVRAKTSGFHSAVARCLRSSRSSRANGRARWDRAEPRYARGEGGTTSRKTSADNADAERGQVRRRSRQAVRAGAACHARRNATVGPCLCSRMGTRSCRAIAGRTDVRQELRPAAWRVSSQSSD
jgi:hypothetical protein